MKIKCRLVGPAVALVMLLALSLIRPAEGNHYILPCGPDCQAAAAVPIGPGMTGSWSVPGQIGPGFMLEVLPGTPLQLLVSWFVYAPQGGLTWIVGRGPIDGTQVEVQGYQLVGPGGRFPPGFDPLAVHTEAWGTLTFTFSDCGHGHVEWTAIAPGYASGGTDLVRSTLPAGLACSDGNTGNASGDGGVQP